MTDNISWIDDPRSTCLCDVGLPNYLAAVTIAPDGTEHLLLAKHNAIGDETATYDRTCSNVTHEQPGPLSPQWADRVAPAPFRCGRTTLAGQPCRMYVSRPGDACGWHRRSKSTA